MNREEIFKKVLDAAFRVHTELQMFILLKFSLI